jgi:hypothetical protein
MEAAFSSTTVQPLATARCSQGRGSFAVAHPLPTETVLQSGSLAPASSLLFLDAGLSDYQSLVTGVTAGTEIHLLNSSQDAVTQITQTLLGRDGITSLHIVSHGSVGGLDFGSSRLHLSDLPSYAAQLQSWSQALTADADLLLYGCNVAQGELGQAFTSILSQWTGADVAASDDLTGSSAQGGNWTLEVQTGQIAASLVFQASAITSYQSVLAVDLISQADPTMPNDTCRRQYQPWLNQQRWAL